MTSTGSKTCYTCLKSSSCLTDVLDKDIDSISYMTKLSKILAFKLVLQENMEICTDCIEQLRVSYKFLETVTKSQNSLRKDVGEELITIKFEEVDVEESHPYEFIEVQSNFQLEEEETEESESPPYVDTHHDAESDNSETNNENSFECARCLKKFSDREFLSHACFRSTPKSKVKKNNIASHKNVKTYKKPKGAHNKCDICKESFDENWKLFEHLVRAHNQLTVKNIEQTSKKGAHKNPKIRSTNEEINTNEFKCAQCLKIFVDKEFLSHGCFRSNLKNKACKTKLADERKSETSRIIDRNASHKCGICENSFDDKEKLHEHLAQKHNCYELKSKDFKIKIPFKNNSSDKNKDKSSPCKSEVKNEETDDEIKLKCMKCSKMFPFEELILHTCFKTQSQNKVEQPKKMIPRECTICKVTFDKRRELVEHLSNIHNQYQFKCDYCDKSFKKSVLLKEHLPFHTGENSFSCEICEKTFRLFSSKARHMKTHEAPFGEKSRKTPFLCNMCGRCFPYSNTLQRHMRVHLGIRPHECKICKRRFRVSTHLNVHMRTHTGEKPYMCDACGEAFSLKPSLDNHISKYHGQTSPKRKISAKRKRSREHETSPDPASSPDCTSSPDFSFMCAFCGENFENDEDLQNHTDNIHGGIDIKSFKCI